MDEKKYVVVADPENGGPRAFGPLAEADAHALADKLTEGGDYDSAMVLALEEPDL